jgi:hypothetical protein
MDMDKTQSFARVIVGAMAIFFSVKVLVMAITPVGMLLYSGSADPLWPILLNFAISVVVLVVLQYFGVFRPQRVVRLITNGLEPGASTPPGHWLPAAYRLVCVFAGLYSIYGVLYRVVTQVGVHFYLERDVRAARSYLIRPGEIAITLILLVFGVYFLAGAPHFIRWHLKRTARFCVENPVE